MVARTDRRIGGVTRCTCISCVGLPSLRHVDERAQRGRRAALPRVINLILGRKSLAGSAIGGMAETQEMMDFCAEHNIVSDGEMVPIQSVNEAYERLVNNDVKYRFVIDMASLANA